MSIGRRTFLRGVLGGVAASIALPELEIMLDQNGTAFADGSALPRYFGLFFWANGKPWTYDGKPDLWTPTTVGASYALSSLLEPLAKHRSQLSVISGLEPHTEIPKTPGGQGDGHMRGAAVALTGDRPRSEGFDHGTHTFAFQKATLDQVIAKDPRFYGAQAPTFRSLELGVSRSRFHDYGHWNCISHNGPDALNLPVQSPSELFRLLFAQPFGDDKKARLSILDVVAEDARRLSQKLGARDKLRVDEHLANLREIERRLGADVTACVAPTAPKDDLEAVDGKERNREKLAAMAGILAFALRCDLTRVFSLMFTSPASNVVPREASATTALHAHCHNGDWEVVRDVTRWHMEAFAILLDKLADAKTARGTTLLEDACIYGTSEYGEGFKHGAAEHPVLLAGGAGGALRPGEHVRVPKGNLTRVHLTVLKALGLDTGSFGANGAATSDPLPLLV